MLSVDDARATVLERVPRLPVEHVALDAACGRVLAADVLAPRALPGFDNSAMDGYAARSIDLPATLPVERTIGAGEAVTVDIREQVAVRIFTGAPLPRGLDTVVIQEDATRDGDRVTLPASLPGENIRHAGEDIGLGEAVLLAGTRLSPWHLGVLAALGLAHVPVARAPRVAIFATGDELVPVEQEPAPGQLVDSSMFALRALVTEAGGVPTSFGIVEDELAAITAALERVLAAGAGFDAVITTGGVSVGERDFVHQALATVGVTRELYKVAMKPGKPFSFGKHADRAVFGLPGNPVSTVVAFELFLRPALLAMQGACNVVRPRAHVVVPTGYAKSAGRAHYLRARVVRVGDRLVAHIYPKQGSAMLSSLVSTNALVEIPAQVTEIPPGGPAHAFLLEAV